LKRSIPQVSAPRKQAPAFRPAWKSVPAADLDKLAVIGKMSSGAVVC